MIPTAIFLLCVFLGTGHTCADTLSTPAKRVVVVIPVAGDVEPAMAALIARAIRENAARPDALFVLEMDTFGGRVDAALQIADTLLHVKNGQTIAFVKNKAISAGALIALACNRLVMKHNTTIGDCAPIAISQEGPKMLGEKFQSPLRAQFRTMAKRNGYPQTLAEAMVSEGMVVYRVEFPDTVAYLDSVEFSELPAERRNQALSKKTVVGAGELLTMDDQEAKEYGFSMMSAESVDEMLAAMNITDYDLIRFESNWSEAFVKFIGTIAPILMMVGFAALYSEMKTPGFGLAGIVGIICLGLVFAGQYLVGLADYTELLIFALGLVLLAIELFVTPGFGLLGITGLFFIAVGMVLSMQGFVIPRPEFPWQGRLFERNILTVLASFVGSFVLILLFFRFVLPTMSKVLPGPYLSATLAQAHVDSGSNLKVSAGDVGVVIKPLRPSGSVRIGNTVVDVVAEGEFVETGKRVRVVEVAGNRIVVSEAADAHA